MIQALLPILFAVSLKHSDTTFVYLNRSDSGFVGVLNASPIISKLITEDGHIKAVLAMYNRLHSERFCNEDEDTLDMDIIIDAKRNKVKVRKVSEYEESGVPDSLLKYASRIGHSKLYARLMRIQYVVNCKAFQVASIARIKKGFLDLHSSDSVKILTPEYWCLNERGIRTSKEPDVHGCDTIRRFNGIPIRASKLVDLALTNQDFIRKITDSVGVDHKGFAACMELEGLVIAYKWPEENVFIFDACNGVIEYNNSRTNAIANAGLSTWGMLLNMYQHKASGFNEFMDSLRSKNQIH